MRPPTGPTPAIMVNLSMNAATVCSATQRMIRACAESDARHERRRCDGNGQNTGQTRGSGSWDSDGDIKTT